jgi:hypothetical protein
MIEEHKKEFIGSFLIKVLTRNTPTLDRAFWSLGDIYKNWWADGYDLRILWDEDDDEEKEFISYFIDEIIFSSEDSEVIKKFKKELLVKDIIT